MRDMKTRKAATPQSLNLNCGFEDCGFQTTSQADLHSHVESHLGERKSIKGPTNCLWAECEFQTDDLQELHRHAYYHVYYEGLLVNGRHECEQNLSVPKCTAHPRTFNIPDLEKDFSCEWLNCHCTFASIIEFQDHILQHATFEYEIQKTPENTRPKIECKWGVCNKTLENKYRLVEHISTHSNKKVLACITCGEVFRTKTTLFDHLRRQQDNNTNKYQCAQCFKFFATEKLLRAHVVKHINCFKCSLCDMTCSSSSSLTTHIRYRHLKDKPFKCARCTYQCVRESDLNKHMKSIHKKEVYICSHSGCNYTVRVYNLLRRHYLEVHRHSPFIYICHCCEKLFKNGKSLSSHLIKKHEFQLPSGHKRFTYRVDENGLYRLETMRIESLEVTKQILSPTRFDVSEVTQDSNCYEIVSTTSSNNDRTIVSNDATDTRPLGEVVISVPYLDEYEMNLT